MKLKNIFVFASHWLGILLVGGASLRAQTTNFVYDPPGNLTGVSQPGAPSLSITAQPANQVLSASGNAYFSVVASGTGPLGYQWLSNGVAISGATNDALVFPVSFPIVNLVSNGGFELPSITALSQIFAAGTNVGGWMVESNSVNLARSSTWAPYDGLQSLELNGTLPGSIYQDVLTTSNQQYYLRFDLAGVPATLPIIKTNQVWWGTNLLDTVTFSTAGASTLDMNWTNHEYLVTASSNSTRVRFVSTTTGANGSVLDTVSLTVVAPPPVNYSVIVSNAAGSITSSVVQVEFDSDGNGLPDDWERAYFGAIQQDPNADSDGDGISNLDEYREGTNPTNAASFRPRLSFASTPGGLVVVAPLQLSYALNDTVNLTAVPDPNALFNLWVGGVAGTNPVVNLLMNTNKSVTALFGLVLTNGASYGGLLQSSTSNRYAFQGSAGDNIQVRVGASAFTPRIDLYDPNGVLAGQFAANSGAFHDADMFARLTNSGTYSVVVGSYFAGGSGAFTVALAHAPGTFVVSPGHSGGALTNGTSNPAAIGLGGQDMWSFTASAGDSIQLRVGAPAFTPRIDLYGPDGSLAGQFAVNNGSIQDAQVFLHLTNSGTFIAVVSSYFVNGLGNYIMSLAQAPESFVVSPGHSGGVLTNGASNPGTIGLGGQDMWSFTANSGDSIQLRVGAPAFTPRIDLYGPDGSLAGQYAVNNGAVHDAQLFLRLTNSGNYTAVVGSYFANGSGTYNINLAQSPHTFVVSPGDSGGVLTNGANISGNIALGDQDMWSFMGNAGDNIQLRAGGASFTPRIDLYGPDGSLAGQFAVNNGSYHDADIFSRLTNSGIYTAVVSSYFANGSGAYNVSLAQAPEAFVVSPGFAGGTLTNGAMNSGTIALGGQDMWTFTGNPGDRIQVRIGSPDFTPRLDLYRPDGALAGQFAVNNGTYGDGFIYVQLTNGGAYTLVVSSYFMNGNGNYSLNLAQVPAPFVVSPGDEGGPLTNGASYVSIIQLGDQDMWSFTGNAGDSIQLRVGTSGFTPRIDLYGPGGELTGQYAVNAPTSDAWLDLPLTNTGTYVAVVSSYYVNGSGMYYLNLAQAPEPFVVPPFDEGGALTNGGNHDGVTTLGDEDLWTFTANAGDSILLRCGELSGTASYSPSLRLYGPTGAFLTNDANATDSLINYRATNSGTFTLMVDSLTANNTGSYRLRFMHIPGAFIVPAGDEGGTLAPGSTNDAVIDLGDEDIWNFTALNGVPVTLSAQKLSGTASFSPWLLLYNQTTGAFLTNASSATTATINFTPTNNGVFTLLVGSLNRGATGTYRLTTSGISTTANVRMSAAISSGTNLNLAASGGGSNQTFVIYSSTNLALSANLWTPILTNQFDASGNFVTSNLLNPAQPRQYFRLLLP
jgi:hypothetical protein